MRPRSIQFAFVLSTALACFGCGGGEAPKPAEKPASAPAAAPKAVAKPAAKPVAGKKGGLQSSNEELPGRER